MDGFDYVVTKRDPKTGKVVEHRPYRLHVMGPRGSVTKILELDGKFYSEDGKTEVKNPFEKTEPALAETKQDTKKR